MTSANVYTQEITDLIQPYITGSERFLDIGTGELTTLSLIVKKMKTAPSEIYALDISWSRIWKGLKFAKENMGNIFERLHPFVADIAEIPLLNKSMNITMTCHALEPNGGSEQELLSEIFRITKDKVILFEPCYEINTLEGQQRMDRLGYIKGLESIIEKLGGKLIKKIPLKNITNPLNPTVCFVIEPPKTAETFEAKSAYAIPGTNKQLTNLTELFYSEEVGLSYPTIRGIPILRATSSILTTSLMDEN